MDIGRTSIWFLMGLRSYTKAGFERNSANFTCMDGIDVSGKSFLITGGTRGIGKSTAQWLSKKHGITLHLIGSNKENGDAVVAELLKSSDPTSQIKFHTVDMSNPKVVIDFCKDFVKEKNPLHVLVNNAGILSPIYKSNVNNIEYSFAVNVLGTYLMTENLVQHMIESCGTEMKPRIITVSSGGALTTSLHPMDPMLKNETFNGSIFYAQQKRQQLILNEYWAQKYPGVFFGSMHPGWVDTEGVEKSLPSFYSLMKNKLRTPSEGSDTIEWLAVSPEALEFKSGSFFFDRAIYRTGIVNRTPLIRPIAMNVYVKSLLSIVKKVEEPTLIIGPQQEKETPTSIPPTIPETDHTQ